MSSQKWDQNYINNMRPLLSKRAFFADAQSEYVIPSEPMPYSIVRIRFRTKRDNVDSVFLVCRGDRILMEKVEHDRDFDFYETSITLDDTEVRYHYEIHSGKLTCFYDKRGAVDNEEEQYEFFIIPGFRTPDWAKGAVLYQIYVDRFCKGDDKNTVLTDEYNYIGEHVQKVDDWYKYPAAMGVREFYGGDLKGVMDKLDYLENLGIEAIYFNPLFVSPSNHRYDIQDYDHIDPHIGVILPETEIDPATGEPYPLLAPGDHNNQNAKRYQARVTDLRNLEASNELFAQLVEKCHKRGIKVIIDGVFNHCGSFNKWLDRERIYEGKEGFEKGAFIDSDSPYNSFFMFHNPLDFPLNTSYDGWWGNDTLPKLNYESSPKLQQYIIDVAKKWVSPPYNVDGWRLDVAADLGFSPEFNHEFWKRFRREVKAANPNAIIIAEHYGCPRDWLKGDEWDTVMNYDAFMEPLTWFLTGMQKHSDDFRQDLLNNSDAFYGALKYHTGFFAAPSYQVAMNELSNHDHSRFLTRTNHKVGRMNTLGSEAAGWDVNKAVMRNAVTFQFTWTGAPTIYYGDEAGQVGFTDPDNRRTYPWGREDQELIDFHRDCIRLRKTCRELKTGSTKYLYGDYGIICFARFMRDVQSIIVINNNDREKEIDLAVWLAGVYRETNVTRLLYSDEMGHDSQSTQFRVTGGHLKVKMPPFSSAVFRHMIFK